MSGGRGDGAHDTALGSTIPCKIQTMTAVVTHRPETSFSATENLSVYLNTWDNVEVKIPTNKCTK